MKRCASLLSSILRGRYVAWAVGFLSLLGGVVALANFSNGGFESGDLTGWTVTAYNHNNVGNIASPPEDTLRADLGLTSAGSPTSETYVVSGSQAEWEFDVSSRSRDTGSTRQSSAIG